MHVVSFVRGDWLEFAATLYPKKVLVYSYVVQVPDFPDLQQEQVSIQPPKKCKVPILAQIRPAA